MCKCNGKCNCEGVCKCKEEELQKELNNPKVDCDHNSNVEYNDSLPCGPGPSVHSQYNHNFNDSKEDFVEPTFEEDDIDDELGIKDSINQVIASKEVEGETVKMTQEDIDRVNKELSSIISETETALLLKLDEITGEESQEERDDITVIKDILLGNTAVTRVVFNHKSDNYESFPQSIKDIHTEMINSCDKVINLLKDAIYLYEHRTELKQILDMEYEYEAYNPNVFNFIEIYKAYTSDSLSIKEKLGKEYFNDLLFHRAMLDTNVNQFVLGLFDTLANNGESSVAYKMDKETPETKEVSRIRLKFDVDTHTYYNELINYTNIEFIPGTMDVESCDEEILVSYTSNNVLNMLVFQLVNMFLIEGYIDEVMKISTPAEEETFEAYQERFMETRCEVLTLDTMKKIFDYTNRLING